MYRTWFLRRLIDHFEQKNKAVEQTINSKPNSKKQAIEETLANVEKAKKYFDKLGK